MNSYIARRYPPMCFLLVMVISLVPTWLHAQGGSVTASLSGKAVDDTGGALPGVTVTLVNLSTSQSRSVVTNEEGFYRFPGLAPAKYSITAELQGFITFIRPEVTLNVGAAVNLDMAMRIAAIAETVTVTGEGPIVEAARTDLSTLITREQIETLPSNSRNYLDFVSITPGTVENSSTTAQGIGLNIGGARAKEGSLLVDGFWNTDEAFIYPRLKYSQDSIAEFQVVSLGATAEFGRAIGGIVTAVTKSGTNVFSGSGYGFFRDTRLNAQDFLAQARGTPKSEFDRQVFGGTFGGPIARNRTFFFGAVDRLQQIVPQDNGIRSDHAAIIGLPPEDVGAVNRFLRDTFAMAKINHTLNTRHSIQGAYLFTKEAASPLARPFRTRSRVDRWDSIDHAYQFQYIGIMHEGNWLHELRASYFPRHFPLDNPNVGGPPLTPEGQLRQSRAPAVNITNVADFGAGRVIFDMHTRPWHVNYASTISKKTHSIKFGVDNMFVGFDYFRHSGNPTYNFRSLDHFLRGEYTSYSQLFGDPLVKKYHTYLAAYAQDSWAVSDRLTLNYGVRYDLEILSKYHGQSFGEDHNNFGPRVALSYDLSGKGSTFVKVSSGLYFDHIFQNPITDSYLDNKEVQQQTSATWAFVTPGAPVYPNTFGDTLPDNAPRGVRDVFIVPNDMQVPSSVQVVATLDHAFGGDFAASASAVYSRSRHKEIVLNRNLQFDEVTQRFIRPDPNFRKIEQYSYSGRAEYMGLILEARKRLSGKLALQGNVTVARAYDQGKNYNTRVDDVRFPERDYGPQADTPTFRVTANGSYEISRFIQVSAIFRGRTGYAYDSLAGPTFDLNNDGNFNDRTPGFTRNSFRGPGVHSLDARFTWTVPIRDGRLQFTAEAFNLYNRRNFGQVNETYGPNPDQPDALFGTPLNFFNPREVQLGVRVVF